MWYVNVFEKSLRVNFSALLTSPVIALTATTTTTSKSPFTRSINGHLWIGIALCLAAMSASAAPRVSTGLQALYTFEEGSGNIVSDVSGVGTPLDLTIESPAATNWVTGGLSVNSSAVIASAGAASKVISSIKASNAITVEAWLVPANTTQNGPARIVSLSQNPSLRNFTLGQSQSKYNFRLRSSVTDVNGSPSITTPSGLATTALTHVIYTRDSSGLATVYVDGVAQISTNIGGNLTTWNKWDDGYRLGLANELTGDRPWLGELHLVAIFDRALSAAEVSQNYNAGTGNNDGNLAPIADAGPDQFLIKGDIVSLDGRASSDVDGTITAYSWTQTTGPTVTLSGAFTATPNFTAPEVTIGAVLGFQLIVTDDGGVSKTDQVKITVSSSARVTLGQQVLYTFEEGAGTTVTDVSGVGTPLNLTIGTPAATHWVAGGLSVNGNTLIASVGAANKVITAVKASNALTIETWLIPANTTQNGPARIVSLSQDSSFRNFTLGQSQSAYDVRLRSTATSTNGLPSITTPSDLVKTTLSHVVYTRDAAGVAIIYVDCTAEVIGEVGSSVNIWDDNYRLLLANELTGDRPWQGELHLVSVFDRALSAAEVNQNCYAGPGGSGNVAPIANAGPEQSVTAGDTVSLDGTGSSDTDGTITAYNWVQIAGPMITLNDASTATPNFTAPSITIDTVLSFQLIVTDNEGDTGSATVNLTVQNIADTTPTITATISPDANAAGWHNSDVIVNFTCNDADGDITSCPTPVTVTTEGATQTIIGTVNDSAGNSASTSVTLNIDKTPPAITSGVSQFPNAAGWNNSDVTSTFICLDSLSGMASCTMPIVTSTEAANQTITGTAVDLAGNVSTDSFVLNIDKTAPSIQINEPLEGAVISGSTVVIRGNVNDSNNITSFTIDGAPVVLDALSNFEYTATLPEGSSIFSFQSTDIAGNTRNRSLTVSSIVAVNNPPTITSVPAQFVSEDSVYNYSVTGNDVDLGDSLIYSLLQAPSGMTINSSTGQIDWSPTLDYLRSVDAKNTTCLLPINPDLGSFSPVLKWKSGSQKNLSVGIVAPLRDTNGDGLYNEFDTPVILLNQYSGGIDRSVGYINAINGDTGSVYWKITDSSLSTAASATPAVGDIDGDNIPDIVMYRSGDGIVVLNNDGSKKWDSEFPARVSTYNYSAINLADLDGDGLPEILARDHVLNNDGSVRWVAPVLAYHASTMYTADFNLDGLPEVIVGERVYTNVGADYWDNTSKTTGYSGVANFDGDPNPELVSVSNSTVQLFDHDGALLWRVAFPGGGGGPPTIGDMTGDGFPNIGSAGLNFYVVFDHQGNLVWKNPINEGSSRSTGSTLFDFNGDGIVEVLYADQSALHVYNGTNGAEIYRINNGSATVKEYPVVADIDNDGHAEFLLAQGVPLYGIRAFEDINDSWMPTRTIWNQYDYNINNVNADASIPANPTSGLLTHNSFRMNTFPDYPARGMVDLRVSRLRLDENGSNVTITATVENRGLAPMRLSTTVKFYHGNPELGGTLLGVSTPVKLGFDESVQVSITASASGIAGDLYVVVDEESLIEECGVENNRTNAAVVIVQVADLVGEFAQQMFAVSVDDVNESPVITSTPTLTTLSNENYQYQVIVADNDLGDGVKFSLVEGPAGMKIDPYTGLITWLPTDIVTSDYVVSIRAVDLSGATVDQSFTVSVHVNQPPMITSAPVINATELMSYAYQVIATDPNPDDLLSYNLTQAPAGMLIDGVTGLVTWIPAVGQVGNYDVLVNVSDQDGAQDTQNYTVIVEKSPVDQYVCGNIATGGLPIDIALNGNGSKVFSIDFPAVISTGSQGGVIVSDTASRSNITRMDLPVGFPFYIATNRSQSKAYVTISKFAGSTTTTGFSSVAVIDMNSNSVIKSIPTGESAGAIGIVGANSKDFVYVTARFENAVYVINTVTDTIVNKIAVGGYPVGIDLSPDDNYAYVLGRYSSVIDVIDTNTNTVVSTIPLTIPGSTSTTSVAVSPNNKFLFGANNQNGSIAVVDIDQFSPQRNQQVATISTSATGFFDLSVSLDGRFVYAVSTSGSEILVIDVNPLSPDYLSVVNTFIDGASPRAIVVGVSQYGLGFIANKSSGNVSVLCRGSVADNTPPIIISTPLLNATNDINYQYSISVTDPDIFDELSFILGESPAGMSIDAGTGVINWVPDVAQVGFHTVTVVATDSYGFSDQQSFSINVALGNQRPQIISSPILSAFEGQLYVYDVDATDPDDDLLAYNLTTAPTGMTIDVSTGLINWIPLRNQSGTINVVIQVDDSQGGSTSQDFNVLVEGIPNVAPIINSTPPLSAAIGLSYMYDVDASDSNGDTLIYSLSTSPVGMSIDSSTGLISWVPSIGETGLFNIAVLVDDSRGGTATQSFGLTVLPNNAPSITSTPILTATENQSYVYDVNAIDVDGDSLTYSLTTAPAGMVITPASGLISWTPFVGQAGTHSIAILVNDSRGGTATQNISLVVNTAVTNVAPTITSTPLFKAKNGLEYLYPVIANDSDGDTLNYSLEQAPVGMVINSAGLILWTPGALTIGAHNITVRVNDGLVYVEQTWTLTVLDNVVPVGINLTLNPTSINAGETVTITVDPINAVDDFTRTATVDGVSIALDSNGQATFTSSVFGHHDVVATVSDVSGTATDSVSFFVNDPSDVTPPIVSIVTPVSNTTITAPVDVVGSVTETNLNEYILAYAPAGTDNFTVITRGTTAVPESVLAQLDPTLMINGLYTLVLQATDNNGQTASDSVTIKVEGDLKAGNFSFTVTDLEIPMSGIPLRVTRTYDSRRRAEALDFGYGWSIGYQNVKVEESRAPGAGWSLNTYSSGPLGLIPLYCVEPLGSPTVTVTLPDGQVESFDVHATQPCWQASPVLDHTLAFTAQSGTLTTLESIDDTSGRLINGNLEFIGSFAPIDPNLYKLTTKGGYIYNLDQSFGITSVIDPNGNTLTYTNDGIFHSDGKSVLFTRDGLGRITDVTDPMGNIIQYQHDGNGDLQSVTDAGTNVTQYTYAAQGCASAAGAGSAGAANACHLLLDIIDPLGRNIVKNIYDTTPGNEGRLIAQEDSAGNRTDFNHNIAGRSSIITDRLSRVTVYGYDDRGNVTTQIDALGNTTTYTFDADDNQLTKTDTLGNITTATFNTRRDQLTQTDAEGNTVTFAYNQRGQETFITDAQGNVFENTYDLVGNLLSVKDPDGNIAGNNIDAKGNVSLTRDIDGNETTYTYDDEGNKLTETDALNNVTTMTYDANNNVLSEARSRSVAGISVTETTAFVYGAQNRVIQTTDALGNITRTEYDAVGNTTAQIDALGNRTTMEYDAYRRLTRSVYADLTESSKTYDLEGNLTSDTDRLGRITTYTYDALNRQIRTTYSDGTTTQTEYDAAGRVIATLDANSNRNESDYDNAGRRTTSRNAMLQETTFSYDANGNLTSQTDANGNTVSYTYDSLDRRSQTTYADTSTLLESYDALGRVISKTDQAGLTTTYEYDALGRLTAVIDALNQRTEYTYDEAGNKLTQRDAKLNTTSWSYDALGRVKTRTLPEGQSENLVYDANGNQTSHTDFNGNSTTFEYDTNNRLTKKVYADTSEETYGYDAVGNRTSATNSQGSTGYSYDSQNRLTKEIKPDGTTLDYTYDNAGNRTSVITTLPTTPTVTTQTTGYGFDTLNRLATVTDSASQLTTYSYDAVGNRKNGAYPNGNTTAYLYDTLNRLTQVQTKDSAAAVISQYDYTLGLTGRRDQITDLSGTTTSYSYDDLYRLLSENITGHPVLGTVANDYQYDPTGNRTYATEAGVSTAYAYDANDRLITAGGETYTYDNNGNTLTKTIDTTVVTNTYDPNNRLIQMVKTEIAIETDNVSYQYDTNGLRTAKNDDGINTTYIVDKNRDYAQVLNELDSTSTPTVSYVYGDDLISQSRAANDSYFLYDGLGSTRALSDATGAITDTYDYSAYGTEIDSTGITENSYRYSGEQFDANLNQVYLRARYYDPGVGRFTQQDTWSGRQRNPITLNKYLYANANPISNIDPSGRFSIVSQMAVISTIGILAASSQYSSQIGFGSLSNWEDSYDPLIPDYSAIGLILLMSMVGPDSSLLGLINTDLTGYGDEACTLVFGPKGSSYPGYSEVRYICRQFPGFFITRFIPSVVASSVPRKAPCAPGFPSDLMPRSIREGLDGGAWRECHFRL